MASTQKSIAFIGLGVMGYPMAVNLGSKVGSDTTIYICDVVQPVIDKYIKTLDGKLPIKVVKNGYEAAQVADMVVTMLPDGKVVNSVYLDPQTGILAGVEAAMAKSPRKMILMECGTIETATILSVADATKKLAAKISSDASLDFVDAPVSGGPMGAEAGTLTFMVGTDDPDKLFSKVESVLKHMGNPKGIFLCGKVGAGTAFKVINNYLSAITSLAASEALNIGVKMGLDPKTLTDVINASGGQCWITSNSNPVPGVQPNVPSSRNYEGGFRIELCKKVLRMGSELAEMVGARTILDKPTLDAFEEAAADERYKGKDARVVYKWLNESTRK